MAKWVKADAKAWPLGYSGSDGADYFSIVPGGVAEVSDAKAAQLLADFPGSFSEVDAKEAAKINAAYLSARQPSKEAKPAKPIVTAQG